MSVMVDMKTGKRKYFVYIIFIVKFNTSKAHMADSLVI